MEERSRQIDKSLSPPASLDETLRFPARHESGERPIISLQTGAASFIVTNDEIDKNRALRQIVPVSRGAHADSRGFDRRNRGLPRLVVEHSLVVDVCTAQRRTRACPVDPLLRVGTGSVFGLLDRNAVPPNLWKRRDLECLAARLRRLDRPYESHLG